MTEQRFDLVVRNGTVVTPDHRERTGRELIEAGRGAVRYFPDARTVDAEVTAVDAAISLAAETSPAKASGCTATHRRGGTCGPSWHQPTARGRYWSQGYGIPRACRRSALVARKRG